MRFPRNLAEWTKAFKDDFGYEPTMSGEPAESPPGSPEKIAILRERIERGHRLWEPADVTTGNTPAPIRGLGFTYAGSERFGAVIGTDHNGHKHRYAIWSELGKGESPAQKRLLYVTATASYTDSFEKDGELAAIKRHAVAIGAQFIAVAPLFSARIRTERDLVDLPEPITEVGYQWIRWLAKNVAKIVVCWGETPALRRYVDVLWLLNRTNSRIYSIDETDVWPPMINRYSPTVMYRYDYRAIIAELEELEREAEEVEKAKS